MTGSVTYFACTSCGLAKGIYSDELDALLDAGRNQVEDHCDRIIRQEEEP